MYLNDCIGNHYPPKIRLSSYITNILSIKTNIEITHPHIYTNIQLMLMWLCIILFFIIKYYYKYYFTILNKNVTIYHLPIMFYYLTVNLQLPINNNIYSLRITHRIIILSSNPKHCLASPAIPG